MALIRKQSDLIQVPWSSVEEWLQVYKQIYSSNLTEQKNAYHALLVWKARIPMLPVGVECTLGLLQVCLRDREWIPKINNTELSTLYENDLRMMYSTVIMKFLNHISNIADSKYVSLFTIAKQLNIPDWIVDLRHDIAHGYELPSIDVMRIVSNILLTWLHEEYWAAEAKILEESQTVEDSKYFDSEDDENLIDLIELWTAIGLYIKTKYKLISDLPDSEIRETLDNLFKKLKVTFLNCTNVMSYSITANSELSIILSLLLSEISKIFNKGDFLLRREKLIIDCILNSEVFLIKPELLSIFIEGDLSEDESCLPPSLIDFWKDLLLLLQEKKILFPLLLQLILLIKNEKDLHKKLLASLWAKAIVQAFRKQKITRRIYQNLEQKFDNEKKKLSTKPFLKMVENEVETKYPELKNVPSLNIIVEFPDYLLEETFLEKLILNFTKFFENFIPEIWKMSSFLNNDSCAKSKLLDLMKIYSLQKYEKCENEQRDEVEFKSTNKIDKIYSVRDLKEIENFETTRQNETIINKNLADCTIRNKSWELASDVCDWSSSPIGILPWQINDIQAMEASTISPSDVQYVIVKNLELPKIINSKKLILHSKIHWERLLEKKKAKRKVKTNKIVTSTIVNRAMKNVNNNKQKMK